MTTNATPQPASHADCTHDKTKAARSICRTARAAGRTYDEQVKLRIMDNATDNRKATSRANAAKAAKAEPTPEPEEPAIKSEAVSGFCGNGTHDRCPGGGRQWACTCDCHTD